MWVTDRSRQMTAAVVVMIANFYLLSWVWDATVVKDAEGRLRPVEVVGWEFYALCALLLVSCLGTAFLIRFKSSDLRWGARILFCVLPAMVGLYLLATELGMLG